jgi:hypothetical protein
MLDGSGKAQMVEQNFSSPARKPKKEKNRKRPGPHNLLQGHTLIV